MKKLLRFLPAACLFLSSTFLSAQAPEPFEGCPGVSVAITRPGFNLNLVPHQIYLIDANGAITPTGDPIDLQINAFGLNGADGFLYGMYQTFNVANPFLARVGKNGKYENVGTILGPPVNPFKVALINTTAGTIDDKDNYYFTAAVIDLSNVLLPPDLYVGKISDVSHLHAGNDPLTIDYKKIAPGNCVPELLNALQNPLNGILQDIAFNVGDGSIYTFLPGVGGAGGKIASFDPSNSSPEFKCIDPATPNPSTADLSGLFFSADTSLFILTTDGKYYKGNVQTGVISLVTQTTLPLQNGNLRGDMASCLGKKQLQPFEGCPGLALAITRPGINSTVAPHQVFTIDPSNGNVQPIGHPIDLQINAFGLNTKDGFLYGMHEVSNVVAPTLARVDSNGDHVDINTLSPPITFGSRRGVINTAAATMDGNDNYYFTAVTIDTESVIRLPRLYLGIIRNVSQLKEGDKIRITYRRILLGSCIDEILQSLSNPGNGLFQDIAYNPDDGRIYTYIQSAASPAPGKLASFRTAGRFLILHCINPEHPNEPTQDLSGMHAGNDGKLFILTTDGKYYQGDPHSGVVSLVAQTSLPLSGNNLRGDMASCVKHKEHHYFHREAGENAENDTDNDAVDEELAVKVLPNPVSGDELTVFVNSQEQTTVELRVLDVNGNVNKTIKQSLIKGDNQVRVPVRNLKSGMYAVVLVFPSGKTNATKFIRL